MIIIDFNQTLISSLMSQIGSNPNKELSESLIRHMVLSTILSYKKRFGREYGKLVFAADDKNYWRRDIFPYYKAGRKKAREDSGFDWNLIFTTLNKIKAEIKDNFPYKVIQVERTEADDIIAVISKYTQSNELDTQGIVEEAQPVLIISGDKDFLQLHKYPNVRQYSPMQKKFLTTASPSLTLKEHIIRGDSGDGVPNFLSDDSCFVDGKKQSSVFAKKVDVWLTQKPEEFCDEKQLRNYKRNEQLIDLTFVPESIEQKVLSEYAIPVNENRAHLFDYFMTNGLKYLMEDISEF